MKTAIPLRTLAPGAAWNDALRRSLAICTAGFFLPNLFAEFGVVPQLHQSFHFLPGVCGAAGAFLASLALFMGHYHRKAIQGAAFGVASLILPYLVTWFWFRLAHPSNAAGLLQLCGPTAVVAVVIYGALVWWHACQSNLTIEVLSTQLGEDEYGMPTSRWQQLTYRVCWVIGFILILLVLFAALTNGN
jgi:hypothetical protein